ncbi:hypothetical protein ACFPN7_46605 [Amycolatopsis halotolerans]
MRMRVRCADRRAEIVVRGCDAADSAWRSGRVIHRAWFRRLAWSAA